METYISFLRGINVSGRNLIKMTQLKAMYEALGYEEVVTYIQSGNVIFKTEKQSTQVLSGVLSKRIRDVFGMDVPVIVYSQEELQQIADQNPFLSDKSKSTVHMYILFLSKIPAYKEPLTYAEKYKASGEEIVPGQRAIYLYLPDGYGKSKLTNTLFEKALGIPVSARNWTTTLALLNMVKQIKLHLN